MLYARSTLAKEQHGVELDELNELNEAGLPRVSSGLTHRVVPRHGRRRFCLERRASNAVLISAYSEAFVGLSTRRVYWLASASP